MNRLDRDAGALTGHGGREQQSVTSFIYRSAPMQIAAPQGVAPQSAAPLDAAHTSPRNAVRSRAGLPGEPASAALQAPGSTARLVLRIQCGVLACAFVIAFMLGALAPAKGNVNSSMALPDWNDGVQTHQTEVESFAARVVAGFGVRHEVALEFSPWILEAASRQQLSPELLAGLVLTESSFRKNVTSAVGAIGPAQVRPDYWSQFCGTADLGDPEENIYCGAQILAHYVERCGAEECALSAYNVGPYSRKQQAGERYVAKVAQWRDALENVSASVVYTMPENTLL